MTSAMSSPNELLPLLLAATPRRLLSHYVATPELVREALNEAMSSSGTPSAACHRTRLLSLFGSLASLCESEPESCDASAHIIDGVSFFDLCLLELGSGCAAPVASRLFECLGGLRGAVQAEIVRTSALLSGAYSDLRRALQSAPTKLSIESEVESATLLILDASHVLGAVLEVCPSTAPLFAYV